MKTLTFLCGLLFCCHLQGQKVVKKALVDSHTTYIQIDSQNCYYIALNTGQTNEVKVEANIEGEYAEDLLVNLEEKGATMLISSGFHPNFTNPNDKLSAHKVISIALKITVPAYKEVSIFGTNCNVEVEGKYKNLEVRLSDGRCVLKNVEEVVHVETQKGDILLATQNGTISAKSTYGKVNEADIPLGRNQYILNTVEGTILLKKTK